MRIVVKIFLLIFIILPVSCGKEGGTKKKIRLIPSKDLVPVLTDLYIADGLLSNPPVKARFSAKDSVLNYIDIISKHGYTKDQLDQTLRYYFVNKPKKLEKIYDQVLAQLSAIQAEIETESKMPQGANLWNLGTELLLPGDSSNNNYYFSIPVKDTGIYILSFDYILYPDDQSINPRSNLFFWHADSTKEGARFNWENTGFIKDGVGHNYSLRKRLSDTTFTHINGWLFASDSQAVHWRKHARFSDISLTHYPVE